MIKINRFAEPSSWKNEKVKTLESELSQFHNSDEATKRQRKPPTFNLGMLGDRLKDEIFLKSLDKCVYCESPIVVTSSGDIDHFRPQNSAANLNGRTSRDHYWWLSTEWTNLYGSCEECNRRKRNYFPTINKRTNIQYVSKSRLFEIEKPLLIDPEFENPEEHFHYDIETGEIIPLNERANVTIDLLGLNREKLVEARLSVIRETKDIFSKIENEFDDNNFEVKDSAEFRQMFNEAILWLDNSTTPYLGIRRFMLRKIQSRHLQNFNQLLPSEYRQKIKLKSIDDREVGDWITRKEEGVNRFEIDTLSIKNYRSISDLSLRFRRTKSGNAGWIMLIGENGVGKSSTLRAVLKALVGRSYRNYGFGKTEVKRNERSAHISIHFRDIKESVEVDIENKSHYNLPKNYFINSSIIAFGPFKHSNPKDRRTKDFIEGCHIDNFIDPSIPLHYPLIFLLRLNHRQFNEVALGLLNLLLLEDRARIHRNLKSKEVWIQFFNKEERIYFDELSDGYKSVITMACNIMEGLLRNNENIENAQGLVIIDELGANLHPRWKMQIVKRLRKTFPQVQFLATTHDPLCLKGIEEGETWVLRETENEIQILNDLPSPSNLRADQLLTSEFFGLYSTQDEDTELLFKQYYELLSLAPSERTKDYNVELKIIKDELKKRKHLGDSLREEIYYDIVDLAIAKKEKDFNLSRDDIKEEAKKEAIKLLDNFLENL